MTEFRVSSFCTAGHCVEVGVAPDGAVLVRDTKTPGVEALRFSADEWTAFLAGAKAGEFDLA